MAGLEEKYDSAFLGILQNEGQIANFLEAIFGFLYRRTDFYKIMTQKEAKMGFPPGVAKKIVLGAFKKYEGQAKMDVERRQKLLEQQAAEKLPPTPAPAQDTASQGKGDVAEVQKTTNEACCLKPVAAPTESLEPLAKVNTPVEPQSCGAVNVAAEPQVCEEPIEGSVQPGKSASGEGSDGKAKKPKTDDGEEDDNPELTKQQKAYQSDPESYNGAIRENYKWGQSIKDVDVRIKVPNYIQKGSCVKVDIARKHLKVSYRDESGNCVVVVDDNLCWDIFKEESMWTLVPGDHVHVNLEKVQERWWEAVLEGEPKISVRKIDPSRPMTDLDDEAQAKIEEMMYNEHQKRLGLPQSHEQKVHDVLKKAWDAEGSPFKGQAFDPSKLNISPNSVS